MMSSLALRVLPVFLACWLLGMPQAHAIALGKIEVASHLNEAFFADIPLQLKSGEHIAGLSVGLASPADYRILEVYRDPAVDELRADVKHDKRGNHVELSSVSVVTSPFFNLVLKVHQGHATYFKKYPVFLELPRVRPAQVKHPLVSPAKPPSEAGKIPVSGTPAAVPEKGPEAVFMPFDGWARIGRYGPMVYGDTIGTVAGRLRIDSRFTLPQVMVALFEKNRKKFERENINLIKAGVYLDVPSAHEVGAISPAQAMAALRQHMRRWKQMREQPHYAAVARAQKNRYKARVRVGEVAMGAPATEKQPGEKSEAAAGKPSPAPQSPTSSGGKTAKTGSTTGAQAMLENLRKENSSLRERLKTDEEKLAAISARLKKANPAATAARIRKLEFRTVHIQAELKQARQQVRDASGMHWITYAFAGLVVLLLGTIGYLLRRERPHPAGSAAAVGDAAVNIPRNNLPVFEDTERTAGVADARAGKDAGKPAVQEGFKTPERAASESPSTQGEAVEPVAEHLTEADVYIRYGMVDEAIHQIRLAIEEQPARAEAHCRLVQLLREKGDKPALDDAIRAGRQSLTGEDLQSLEAAIASPDTETSKQAEAGMLQEIDLDFPEIVIGEGEGEAGSDDVAEAPATADKSVRDAGDEKTIDREFTVSPGSLNVDKGKSLIAEGKLDEAESAFHAAAEEGQRCEAAIGLAEVALQRGDTDPAAKLLADAEKIVDDGNRDWLEAVKVRLDQ